MGESETERRSGIAVLEGDEEAEGRPDAEFGA
jgi:hypothetical protein